MLWTQQAEFRHAGPRRFAELLGFVCAQANDDAFVLACGWTHEEYERWIGDTLIHALLPAAGEPPV